MKIIPRAIKHNDALSCKIKRASGKRESAREGRARKREREKKRNAHNARKLLSRYNTLDYGSISETIYSLFIKFAFARRA